MKFGPKPGTRNESEGPETEVSAAKPVQAEQPRGKGTARRNPKRGYLDGQMLIAMPTMGDERFARSVIYVCAHTSEGAMGIIINHPASHISFRDLLVQLDVVKDSDKIQLPPPAY